LKSLDRILLEKEPIYPPESLIAAAFRKAVILADLSRSGEAGQALQSADKQCAGKCALSYSIDALRARLMLLDGDADGALELAITVSKQNEAGREEQANALRVAAAAEEKLARSAGALQHFQAALELDRSLALSVRIGEDLNGMARASTRLGRDQDAAEYARRAVLVNEAYRQGVAP